MGAVRTGWPVASLRDEVSLFDSGFWWMLWMGAVDRESKHPRRVGLGDEEVAPGHSPS